jgi:hypothetical protein
MAIPGYPPVPIGGSAPKQVGDAADASWVKKIAELANNVLKGKINVVLPISLTPSATSTTIIDARIGPYSALLLQPLTVHAAAALYSATSVLVDPTSQKQGSVIFDHASDTNSDKIFNLVILG